MFLITYSFLDNIFALQTKITVYKYTDSEKNLFQNQNETLTYDLLRIIILK